jgi:hypothetical protein
MVLTHSAAFPSSGCPPTGFAWGNPAMAPTKEAAIGKTVILSQPAASAVREPVLAGVVVKFCRRGRIGKVGRLVLGPSSV